MKAFEDATGEALDEDKKELASEELIITGDLGEDIGADKATGIVNDIKTEIIKNNTSDTIQIADTINNVTNNYNITLSSEQQKQLEDLMTKISQQDYNYKEMKNTLNGIKDTVAEKLDAIGEGPSKGFFETIKGWFESIGDWFKNIFDTNKEENLGILGSTNDELLGENAVIDATNENAINLPSSEEVEGFFAKIWHWFTGLFTNNDSNNNVEENNNTNNESTMSVDDNSNPSDNEEVNSLEENSTVDENVQPDSSTTLDTSIENNAENTNDSDDTINLNTENTNIEQ